jgi:hypothetical protein
MVTVTSPSYFGDYGDDDQPTLNGVTDYIADARTLLQDTVPPYRYDDSSLLVALNITMLIARRLRPDWFVFNFPYQGQVQAFTANDNTHVNIEPQFRDAILNGIVGHALERDQEDYQDTRASAFLGLFMAGLIGKALGPVQGGSPPQGRPQ